MVAIIYIIYYCTLCLCTGQYFTVLCLLDKQLLDDLDKYSPLLSNVSSYPIRTDIHSNGTVALEWLYDVFLWYCNCGFQPPLSSSGYQSTMESTMESTMATVSMHNT